MIDRWVEIERDDVSCSMCPPGIRAVVELYGSGMPVCLNCAEFLRSERARAHQRKPSLTLEQGRKPGSGRKEKQCATVAVK
jgi:ribosome-binding protein aMBF1 (putative translation factor)